MSTRAAEVYRLLRRPRTSAITATLVLVFWVAACTRVDTAVELFTLLPVLAALAVLMVVDCQNTLLPDIITLPLLGYALARAAAIGHPPPLHALAGAVAAGGVLLIVAVLSRGAIGGGDVKLMSGVGALLGSFGAFVVLALSQVAGLILVIGLYLKTRHRPRGRLPVGSLIAFFTAAALIYRS